MGDYTVGETLYFLFTTRSFSTGAPTVLAGTPVVSAYEDDSTTQITAGITLGVDHDTVVGLNLLTVVATGANGYEAGKQYHLVITTGTVGGVSVVGEVVADFSLEAEAAFTRVGAAGAGLTAIPWNASWDAEVQSEVEDALDVTLADSTVADGSRPTLRQCALALYRFLFERSISGTTMTVYKEDGATAVMTFTLNDSADPSSTTRAT